MNQETTEIMDKLSGFFRGQKEVRVAYLFGSVVSGKTGPLSDVDVGVFLDESLNKEERFKLKLKLMYEISGILGTGKIDIIIINDAPLLLKENIIKTGRILDSKNEMERVKVESDIMSSYLDSEYYVNRHADMFIKKVAMSGLT